MTWQTYFFDMLTQQGNSAMTWRKIQKNNHRFVESFGIQKYSIPYFCTIIREDHYFIWLSVKSNFFHNEVITTGTSWQDSVERMSNYQQLKRCPNNNNRL